MGEATSKLLRGLLEPLLLDSIAREPKHGYALIQELTEVFGAPPNRNQVYPLLNRLEKDGYLHADRSGGRGKTRYALTGKGLELLKAYRVRTGLFKERVGALWLPEALARAAPPEPPAEGERPPAAQGERGPREPRLLERVAVEGEAPFAAPRREHRGGPCTAEVAMRRLAGSDRVAVEFAGLDPSCPVCREMLDALRGLRDRWFGGPTPS